MCIPIIIKTAVSTKNTSSSLYSHKRHGLDSQTEFIAFLSFFLSSSSSSSFVVVAFIIIIILGCY